MIPHASRPLLAFSAVLALGGCNQPTGPATPGPAGARLTVDVLIPARFAVDPALTAHVSAWLTPGRDRSGALREVKVPLRVANHPISLPIPARSDWATVQSVVVPLSPVGGHATFTVEAPVVSGVQPTIPARTFASVRLTEPDTVRVGFDGSLRFHPQAASGAASADAPTTRQWTLAVTGTSTLQYTVNGPLPPEIVVPKELLPAPSLSAWRVQLTINDTYGPSLLPEPGGEYDVILRLSHRIYRTAIPTSATFTSPNAR